MTIDAPLSTPLPNGLSRVSNPSPRPAGGARPVRRETHGEAADPPGKRQPRPREPEFPQTVCLPLLTRRGEAADMIHGRLAQPALTLRHKPDQLCHSIDPAVILGQFAVVASVRTRRMLEQRQPRQIATVVSVDAVGYSKLMHADDELALRLFDERRDLIRSAIESAGGSIFSAVGDSLMALFSNPIVALNATMQFQEEIRKRNAAAPADQIMSFRAGINAGPVVIRPDGIFGDAVNIAARVQEFSSHGGVALAEAAFLQIDERFDLPFTDLGAFHLKNIPMPVRVFLIDRSYRDNSLSPLLRSCAPPKMTAGDFEQLPALAVLPFQNRTGDPALSFLCDGIAGDILLGLANTRSIPVIARDSSFQFREPSSLPTAAIGSLLGARYVVSGAVSGDIERIKVEASLADSSNSRVIWAGRLERRLDEVQRLQRELGGEIVSRLESEVDRVEQVRTFQVQPEALSTWQLLRRGRWHMQRRTSGDTAQALAYFARAHDEDPNSCAVLAELAWWHLWKAWLNFADREELKIVFDYARRASRLDGLDARPHCYLGFVDILEGRPEQALDHFHRAIDINPSFSLARTGLGSAKGLLLDTEEGIFQLREAIRLSPFETYLFHNLGELAAAHTIDGDWEAVIKAANRSLSLAPNYFYSSYLKTGALARSDRFDEARQEARLFHTRHPGFEPKWIEWIPFRDRSVNQRMIANFQLAG
ncbi:adenylate/guanylate cyclase domain-containing protein [Bosea sp. BH3]|uniref:adenylate/guanylate cyclase domain-containing protein n=1 Tax=Bosea sp. BH3 TaxID=2871701 RepID=UPI0021CAEB50|nr:adenylate/guanylate cyclase domain-containing protein [Bosea sp. BH3]